MATGVPLCIGPRQEARLTWAGQGRWASPVPGSSLHSCHPGGDAMPDPIYDDLPDEEELIFLKLESAFRETCERNVIELQRNEENGYFPAEQYLRYMRQTTAIATELQLGILHDVPMPNAEDFSISDYRNFLGQVDYWRTVFSVRHARRSSGYSVRFDARTRSIINHHLGQIREIIQRLEVDEWKRDSLLNCLDALQVEIDKNRSGYEVFGAFVIEISGVLGEAADNLKPVQRLIDSVAGLIWGTKHAEQTKSLPSRAPRKQIPGPKTEPPKMPRGKRSDMDDEIPF
jgi:hypothetical protein